MYAKGQVVTNCVVSVTVTVSAKKDGQAFDRKAVVMVLTLV